MGSDRFGRSNGTGWNAVLGWLIVALLTGLAILQGLAGSYRWFILTGLATAVMVLPPIALRNPYAVPPWELLAVVAVPVVDAAVLDGWLSPIAVYLAVAAVALVVAIDVLRFTSARMNRRFAVAFVVIATLAVAATWNVGLWAADAAFGTTYLVGDRTQDAANRAMMIDFLYAAVAGVLAGVLFTGYLRRRSFVPAANAGTADGTSAEEPDPRPAFSHERFDLPEEHLRWVSRAMQVALAVLLVYGLFVRDVPTIVNASIALAVTLLPAFLERNYRLPIEPELVIWLTAAAFLHVLGSAGLYDYLGQWDNLTHALSASLVAAAGYTVVRAIDLHTEEVYIPSKLMFAFILLFVLAVGVVWELAEFAIDLAAQRFGFEAALAQHGVNDTVGDLLFDLAGAIVAAALGATYLTDASRRIAVRFGERDR